MVVWINGPYGVGKSTLAERLRERCPESFLFDAEAIGNAVRDNLPPAFSTAISLRAIPAGSSSAQSCSATSPPGPLGMFTSR